MFTQLLTIDGLSFINQNIRNGRRNDYYIYKKNHPLIPKQVVKVFNLGYLGVEKDFPEQLSSLHTERKEIWIYMQKKDIITKTLLKEE